MLVGETLQDIGTGDFLIGLQKQEKKARIDKCDYTTLKSFCTAIEATTRVKKQPTKWKEILASYLSNIELISRIYKECKSCNSNPSN
jgi:hypothetical protein